MSMQHAEYVLLFLVLAIHSNWLQIFTELYALTPAACSFVFLPRLIVYIYPQLLLILLIPSVV